MKKTISHAICFVLVYLLLYFAPIAAIYSTKHMPRLLGNFCFSFPQLMFPFDIIFWKYHSLDGRVAFLISVLYLILLAWFFSFLTRSVKKFRWIPLFAFCFSFVSVIALNLVLFTLGVFGISVNTVMP
jgi:hypothetical protein